MELRGRIERTAAVMEKENNHPKKKIRLSLSRKRKPLEDRDGNTTHFAPPTSIDALEKAAEGVVPSNTKSNTKWATGTFASWLDERNKLGLSDQLDSDVLSSNNTLELSRVLRVFVLEARKTSGEQYPPGTNLLSGINREISKNRADFSIIDKNDRRFRELRLTLDSVSSDLHRTGNWCRHQERSSNIEGS